jgi:hypothetical protein
MRVGIFSILGMIDEVRYFFCFDTSNIKEGSQDRFWPDMVMRGCSLWVYPGVLHIVQNEHDSVKEMVLHIVS